jgi:tRNA (guanine-N7-)-methyltransferase
LEDRYHPHEMKPKDLKPILKWDERRVYLDSGILYIPDHYKDYEGFLMPPLGDLFGNDRPVAVEFCTGHGHWIVEKAQSHPEMNWIAVELRFDRVRKIWSKRENSRLPNLFVVCGDARLFARHYMAPQSIAAAFVNFPDPWPKQKHAKHRLIQPPFLCDLRRGMREGSRLTLVTDDPIYRDQMIRSLMETPGFCPEDPSPHFLTQCEGYGGSYFNQLWDELGRSIYFLRFLVN